MRSITRPISYPEYRKQAVTGDILLCRPASLEGRWITEVTHESYSHAAAAGWAGADALMLAETRQGTGARLISLSGEVDQWSGYYDVFRPIRAVRPDPAVAVFRANPFDSDAFWSFMCHAAGTKYGWRFISRVWARRRLGHWVPPIQNSDDPRFPRDCSGLVHAAMRVAGGPQLRKYDCDVVPGDLAESEGLEYRWTLYASQEEVAYSSQLVWDTKLKGQIMGNNAA